MALQITQNISNFPPPPQSGTDDEVAFNIKSDAFVDHQANSYTPEVNQWANQANLLSTDLTTRSDQVTTDAAQVASDKQFVDNSAGFLTVLSGRNILIDGEVGRINQSEFDGNWGNLGDGFFGYDMWQKNGTSTYISQWIEEGNYKPNAVYTLSGNNVTTQQVTAPASGNWRFGGTGTSGNQIPTNASNVQCELGTVATEFEILPYSDQLARVQYYYIEITQNSVHAQGRFYSEDTGTSSHAASMNFQMKGAPTITYTGGSFTNCTHHSIIVNVDGFTHRVTVDANGSYEIGFGIRYFIDARLLGE